MDTKAHMRGDGMDYVAAATRAKAISEGAAFDAAEIDALNLVPDAYRGMDRYDARDLIVKQITADNLAVMTDADDPNTSPPSIRIPGRRRRKEFGVWRGPEDEIYVCDSLEQAIQQAQSRYPNNPVELAPSEMMEDGVFYRPNDGGEPTIVFLHPAFPCVENKKIMQPFGDRSKVVIEPMLTQQWYVDTAKIVKPALDAVRNGDVKIIPESGEKTYYHWLENIEPWCISRQLWWGHRIPVWYGPDIPQGGFLNSKDDEGAQPVMFCAASEEDALKKAQERYGSTVQIEIEDADDNHRPSYDYTIPAALENGGGQVTKVTLYRDRDVLDTWFSSGLWPIGTLGWPADTDEMQKYFPTNVLITGFDILFFWVARMIMMQLAVVDKTPFHTVYLHALVRDEHGKKMSKSTGNVIDPLEMIDEFGADAVRFTLSAMGRDLKLSKERFIGYRNFGTKLWNAARFAEMNECKPGSFDPASATQTVNKWIIGETVRALHATDKALENYRFSDASMGLYAHVWGKLCDWYVEFAKPLFQSDDEAVKAETRATMAWAIDQSLIMLHPVMPYITEQLWGDIAARKNMLVHQDWPELPESLIDEAADREMNWVISLIDSIRSVRAEMRVPAGAKIPMVQLELDEAGQAALKGNALLIRRLARLSDVSLAAEAPKGAVTVAVQGGTFCLPLAEIIDLDAEKARLSKTMDKLAREIGGLKGKLGNEKFLAKAPEKVVQENRENLLRAEGEAGRLAEALKRLEALG